MSLTNVDSSNGYLEATATNGIAVSEVITQDTGSDIINSSASNEFTTLNVVNVGDDLVIKKLDDTTHELSVVNVDQNPISIKESVTMTSYTNAEGFIVTVSSASNPGTFDGFDAFNDTSDISNNFWRSGGSGGGNWIAMEFPVAKIINNIDINGYRNGASSSTLTGCDVHGWDGSAYVLLGSFTFSPVWANYEIRNISFANSTAYIKYKITGTSLSGNYFISSYIAFLYNGDGYTVDTTSITAGEIPQAAYELSGYDNAFASVRNIQSKEEYINISEAIVADTLATSSPIADGDSLVIVKDDDTVHEVVASGVIPPEVLLEQYRYQTSATAPDISTASDSYRPAYYGFDGRVGHATGWVSSNNSGVKWLKLELEVPKAFTNKIGLYNDTGSGNNFNYAIFQGSNDNVSWDDLVSCVNTLPETEIFGYIEFLFTNTVEYKYYRLYLDGSNPPYTVIPNTELFFESSSPYEMDTAAVTAGEIPSRVFTIDSKVAFDDGTGFTYPNELGNDYLVSGASLTNTRQYGDITIDGRTVETKVELKSLGDKCTEVSADLWKLP